MTARRSASAFSVSSVKAPYVTRSGGISVLASQPPFTYRYRSSWGRTEESNEDGSRPDVICCGASVTAVNASRPTRQSASGRGTSVFGEHPLNFCAVVCLRQRKHQEDSSLYRREIFSLNLEARRRGA